MSVGVLRPLAAMSVRERAELMAMRAARELAALPTAAGEDEVRRVLRASRVEGRPFLAVFHDGAGRVVVEPPMPPGARRGVLALLGGATEADSLARGARRPPGRAGDARPRARPTGRAPEGRFAPPDGGDARGPGPARCAWRSWRGAR